MGQNNCSWVLVNFYIFKEIWEGGGGLLFGGPLRVYIYNSINNTYHGF